MDPYTPCEEYGHRYTIEPDPEVYDTCVDCGSPREGAEMADTYADLPVWCRPGATVARIGWSDTTLVQTIATGTVDKITKTLVVVRYPYRGTVLVDRIPRARLVRHGRPSGGARLVAEHSEEAADVRAVARARALHQQVDKLYDGRGRSVTRGVAKKPLQSAADALDLLAEIERAVAAARQRIQADALLCAAATGHEQEGA